jgi:hypothetical protein
VRLQALRERLRCKEIWVLGAHEWRNPDEDLPDGFETHRVEHSDKLHKPLDPAAFTAQLREEMRTELAALNDALPGRDWLRTPTARAARSNSRRWTRSPRRGTSDGSRGPSATAGGRCR